MFCSNCGKEIPDHSKVCGFCGTVVVSGQSEELKPDYKFNITAFFFSTFWLMAKGMWDAVGIMIGISVCGIIIGMIPVIGFLMSFAIGVLLSIFWGRNGNYYYRLKRQMGISFLKAFQDPQLRKL